MFVTIVRFPAPVNADGATPTIDQARSIFAQTAADYLDVAGLLWKAYLRSTDASTVGGAYWWTDRASAEAALDANWKARVTERYGSPPTVEWFDAPIVVDARFDMIRTQAPQNDI